MTLGGHRAARAGAAEPRSILITGGAQGLGAAMVRLFTAAGYQVAVTGIAPATDPYYSAAKDALIGLTRSFALILQKDTITVNAICPGFIHTPLTATVRENLTAHGIAIVGVNHVATAAATVLDSAAKGQAGEVQPAGPLGPSGFQTSRCNGPLSA